MPGGKRHLQLLSLERIVGPTVLVVLAQAPADFEPQSWRYGDITGIEESV